jgi:hypothetical protein
MSTIETLHGLPTFNPATYRKSPPKQTLSYINSRAILLNYPQIDWSKSQKGVLAPILDRAELPDPHFVKTRTGGARDSDWSRPITALTPFGVVYPDGTIGPQNPENGIHINLFIVLHIIVGISQKVCACARA